MNHPRPGSPEKGRPMRTNGEFITFCRTWFRLSGPEETWMAGIRVDADAPIGVLRIDSRAVQRGDIFIAMKGSTSDGHSFIGQAIERGATLVLCDPSFAPQAVAGELTTRAGFLLLPDLRSALGAMAQAVQGYPARDLTVIGVTGTNGKTTVTTLIWQWLRELGIPCSLMGTVSTRIIDQERPSGDGGASMTTSDPIHLAAMMREMVDRGSTHLAMEVSSHALDQERVSGIRFSAAIFTNLSHDHLDYHGSLEAYRDAKKRLFDGLDTDAVAVLNASDPSWLRMAEQCGSHLIACRFGAGWEEGVTSGVASGAAHGTASSLSPLLRQIRAIDVDRDTNATSTGAGASSPSMRLVVDGVALESRLVGRYNAMNLAQAFLCLRALGFEAQTLAARAGSLKGAPGRLERVVCSQAKVGPSVYVDYAHTPDALENVTRELSRWIQTTSPDSRLWVVFGCGGDRDRTKRPVMGRIAQKEAFGGVITSDNPRSEEPDAILADIWSGLEQPAPTWSRIEARREAILTAIDQASPRDLVLVAGKGHETTQEIKGVKHPFDDREVARLALCGSQPAMHGSDDALEEQSQDREVA